MSNIIGQRKQKLNNLKKLGISAYASRFNKKDYAVDIISSNKKLRKDQKSNKKVSVAGRIMTLRVMGKAGFGHIQDSTGQIQIYAREEDLGDDYRLFSKSDLGDIIGVEGTVFRTKKGEISVWVKKFNLLTKNLKPLPEKWHGLKDRELRYRRRYVDLIVNPDVKEVFLRRGLIIQSIREFLSKSGFVEVETPILQPIYGGTNARPFKSYLNNLKMDVYMRISNELYLKRLLVGGYERIFEFSTDFRNEGVDALHNPEFTQVETMFGYGDYKDNMKISEDMIRFVAKKLGVKKIKIGDNTIDFTKSWKRIKFVDAIKKYSGVDYNRIKTVKDASKFAKKLGVELKDNDTVLSVLIKIFEEKVQPHLIQPTLVYDYPLGSYPLSKKTEDGKFDAAFEIFINGWEIGLSYNEQNDPEILREQWRKTEREYKSGDEEAQRMDHDFLNALEIGMPPTSGLGIGIDRLVMVFSGLSSIKDAIFFPFMRPE